MWRHEYTIIWVCDNTNKQLFGSLTTCIHNYSGAWQHEYTIIREPDNTNALLFEGLTTWIHNYLSAWQHEYYAQNTVRVQYCYGSPSAFIIRNREYYHEDPDPDSCLWKVRLTLVLIWPCNKKLFLFEITFIWKEWVNTHYTYNKCKIKQRTIFILKHNKYRSFLCHNSNSVHNKDGTCSTL